MRLPIAFAIALTILAGCTPAQTTVEDAWVRLPAVSGHPAAAYFRLRAGSEPVTLLAVRTPIAIRAELHESMVMRGRMMSMKPLAQVQVPAGATVLFEPADKHVMLFDVSPSLKAGATAKLTLAFADGRTIDANARVVGAGDPAP